MAFKKYTGVFPWKTSGALQIHHRSLAGTLQTLE